jgi:hypothetical protein
MSDQTSPLTVFVSSTIDEFGDLRSAIKVWLEELGFEVMMSEFSDFGREPERDTFDSCFQGIDRCDYFLLLIGRDKGSSFDPDDPDSSVTREEFRRAVSRAQEGNLRILVFVRDEVMTALYERRQLKRMMNDGEMLTPETMSAVVDAIDHIPSRTLHDPDFVRSFVEEVRSTRIGTAPSGIAGSLWTYRFKGFGDIVAAMRATMPVRRSLRRQALLANLDWELKELISQLLRRNSRGVPMTNMDWLKAVRRDVDLGDIDAERPVWLAPEQVTQTSIFLFTTGSPTANAPTVALQEAILSGELLEFDQHEGRMVASRELTAMYELAANIRNSAALRALLDVPPWSEGTAAILQASQRRRGTEVPMLVLGYVFAYHDALVNVLRLAVALHRFIKTGEFAAPALNPGSPFAGMPEAIEAERVSHAQVDGWLDFKLPRQLITGLPEPDLELATDRGREDIARMQETFPEWAALIEAWDARVNEIINRLRASAEYRRLQESDDKLGANRWLVEKLASHIRTREQSDGLGNGSDAGTGDDGPGGSGRDPGGVTRRAGAD